MIHKRQRCHEIPSVSAAVRARFHVVLMSFVTSFGVLFGLSLDANADTVSLRSGEHPGFSRMVIDLEQLPRWSLESNGDTRRLKFDGPPTRIDASRVFDRIGRQRIKAVSSSINEVQFDIGCPCSVSVFGMPGGRVVIDVRDGPPRPRVLLAGRPPDERAGFALPMVLSETVAGQQSPEPSVLPDLTTFIQIEIQDDPPVIEPSEAPDVARVSPVFPVVDQPDKTPGRLAVPEDFGLLAHTYERATIAPTNFLSPFGERQRVSEATSALVDALDRASDLGLVDFIDQTAGPPPLATERQIPPPGAPLPLPIGDRSSLRVSTSLDRDLARLASALGDRAAQSGCLSNYDLDVGSWGDPDAPMNGFSTSRLGLLGEFDAPDIDAARALVRTYLYLSFGAEAKSVLAAFPFEPAEKSVLSFLAEVADGKTRSPDNEAAALLGCQGTVAIWALLSIPQVPPASDVAKSEIAATFSSLPLHLRKHYGPTLVQRFLALNDATTARLIWNAVDRAASDRGEKFILATAELAAANGDMEEAERDYARLEAGRPENAPKAVVRLIRSRLDRGASIDPGLVETAAALSFENRGTSLARELKFEELRGRTALGQWDTVFEELPKAEFAGSLARSEGETLLTAHFVAIAERASVETFLSRAFQANDRLPVGPGTDVARRAIAERLTALGFTNEALGLLDEINDRIEEDALTAARADLAAGALRSAVDRISGINTVEAARLRGEAFERLGQFEAAASAYINANEEALADKVRLRAGDWQSGTGPVSTAAVQVLADVETDAETPLAQNRALVGAAETLRDEIANMRLATAGLLGPTE